MLRTPHGGQVGIVTTADTGGRLEILQHKGGETMKPACQNCKRLKRTIKKLREQIKWIEQWKKRPKGPIKF